MGDITFRKATEADMMLYFNWANDPVTRQNAISKKTIRLEEHKHWFLKRINSATAFMYVFEIDNIPIGQVRFDIEGRSAVISYSVAQSFRGRGLGKKVLQLALNIFNQENHQNTFDKITGIVKTNNTPSRKIFENLGFELERQYKMDDESYYLFSLSSD